MEFSQFEYKISVVLKKENVSVFRETFLSDMILLLNSKKYQLLYDKFKDNLIITQLKRAKFSRRKYPQITSEERTYLLENARWHKIKRDLDIYEDYVSGINSAEISNAHYNLQTPQAVHCVVLKVAKSIQEFREQQLKGKNSNEIKEEQLEGKI